MRTHLLNLMAGVGIIVAVCFLLDGCNKQTVSTQEIAILQASAASAKSRAAAFAVIAPMLGAVAVTDAPAVASFVASYGAGLNAQAAAMANVVAAIPGGLSASARTALIQEAQTEAARDADLHAMRPFILASNASVANWLAAEVGAQDAQTQALQSLAAMIQADTQTKTSTATK